MKKVIICGAGIAGMTAAFHLIESGFDVEIFEARKIVGGRCFSIDFIHNSQNKIQSIDNGQHLFAGAYHNFFELINWLDAVNCFNYKDIINIDFRTISGEEYNFHCPRLIGKLGALSGLLNISSISLMDKLKAIKVAINLMRKLDGDIPIIDFLKSANQSENIIEKFWEPIVLATQNASLNQASTYIFSNVIKKLLLENKNNSNLFFANVPLSRLFANFESKFSNLGGKLHLNTRIKSLVIKDKKCTGIITTNNNYHQADYIISTLPPKSLSKLLPYFKEYSNILPNSTILSLYLLFDRTVMNTEFLGGVGGKIQWIFNSDMILNKKTANYQNITITISAANNLLALANNDIIDLIINELQYLLPETTSAILCDYKILRDKNATALITNKNNHLRPKNKTDIENLFLAGDWTATDLPATIESAATSGKHAVFDNFY